MTVRELYEGLTELWPLSLSCSWDNDGIMASRDTRAEAKRILVSLDASADAIRHAAENGFDVLLTHHPMLFRGVKNVTPDTVGGIRVIEAVGAGLSVISLHTRLDAGKNGVNDTLARICAFEPAGSFGDDDAPGLCRYADCKPMTPDYLAALVKKKLGCPAVRVTGSGRGFVRRIGFCGGDGKDQIPAAVLAGCDAFITGDAGYNMAADAGEESELYTVECGHWHSEQPVCQILAETAEALSGAEVSIYNSCAYRIL